MGLLDDAIREHLELKRKRGADPAELTRDEQEALTPAVREPADVGVAEALEPAPEPPAPEAPTEHVPPPDQGLVPDPEAPAPADAPVPAPAEPAPEPQETVSFDADDIFAEEDAAAAQEGQKAEEDVLEETPDFLQETPEHDRLWFEQKPPRDFDFDG